MLCKRLATQWPEGSGLLFILFHVHLPSMKCMVDEYIYGCMESYSFRLSFQLWKLAPQVMQAYH